MLAFWPLSTGWGEPDTLRFRAGRINYCAARIASDPALLELFGAKDMAIKFLCEYELILELNSFLAVSSDQSPATTKFVSTKYPGITFYFRPSLIAFQLSNVGDLAAEIYEYVDRRIADTLQQVLLDSGLAHLLTVPEGRQSFLRFVKGLQEERDRLLLELRQFPGLFAWPKQLQNAINALT